MELPQEYRKHLAELAGETLQTFELIVHFATERLNGGSTQNPDVFVEANSWTANSQVRKVNTISQEILQSCRQLRSEPAIARIVAETENGVTKIYYVCRTTPVRIDDIDLASYRSPVGRLASSPIGSLCTIPKVGTMKVIERTQLRPSLESGGWNSRNSVLEGKAIGPLTIESLRALFEVAVRDDGVELLDSFLAEEQAEPNIFDGLRRTVLTKMGLRDQPILDQYQDEIFRLPLGARLMILGPPGTGKTTTLIRRLGQKRDIYSLETSEQLLVGSINDLQGDDHASSWLMFTPTDLLKDYLKEAFSREGVPASNRRIRTWDDYRRELARGPLGILKTSTGKGSLVLNDKGANLRVSAYEKPIQWFTEFNEWQRHNHFQQLVDATETLVASRDNESVALGKRLKVIIDRSGDVTMASTIRALADEAQHAQGIVNRLKTTTDKIIKASIAGRFSKNRGFLDELATFIDGLQDGQGVDPDEQDEVDDEDSGASLTTSVAALNAYMNAVRVRARASLSKQPLNRNSRYAKILEWIGEEVISALDFEEIGTNQLVQTSARRFVNPLKSYFDGIPKRYRAFRRASQEQGVWYLKDGLESREVNPLELDVVLLTTLRDGYNLLSVPDIRKNIDSTHWSSLIPLLGLYRNQILVDEATDFSPVQLACMAALARPELQSFFACGDFNQRLTTWGTRTEDELRWVFSDFDIREISVSYRQSRQLNELSRAIVQTLKGAGHVATLPEHVDSEGVPPVLLESADSDEVVIYWLAERIREIEKFVGQMPSTAIFVNSEEEVTLISRALKDALYEHNIQVQACPLGQVVGHDNDVRVFDIQYIKGLEFEAVFFVDVDNLAEIQPELFDKYLYVGATRAATYLGITCREYVPDLLEDLRDHFTGVWATTQNRQGTH